MSVVVPVVVVVVVVVDGGANPPGTYGSPFQTDSIGGATVLRSRVSTNSAMMRFSVSDPGRESFTAFAMYISASP